MTASRTGTAPRRIVPAHGIPVLMTVLLAAGSLAAGYLFKTSLERRTIHVEQGGMSGDVPAGWLILPGSDTLAFVAVDPRASNTQMSGSLLVSDGRDAASIGREAISLDQALREGFALEANVPIRLGGRDGHRFDYTFVAAGPDGGSSVRGIHLYLVDGDKVLAMAYEAPADEVDHGLDAFYRFAASARISAR